MYDVNVSWYSKMLVFQLGGRGFGGGGSGVRQYWDRHTLNGHWCKQMGWLRVDMTLCCYVLLVQKLKSLVRWWIYRCKKNSYFWVNSDWDSPVDHWLHSGLGSLGVLVALEVLGVPALQAHPAERPWVTTCHAWPSLATLAMPTQQPHTTLQITAAGGCREEG